MQTYGRLPVAFVRGEGTVLCDSDGNAYLDFLGGLAVTSLGHAHPEVADAIADQARTLLHVSNLYYNDVQPQARGAARRAARRRTAACSSRTRAPRRTSARSSSPAGTARRNGGPERYPRDLARTARSTAARSRRSPRPASRRSRRRSSRCPTGFRQVAFADLDALAAAIDERVARGACSSRCRARAA